MKEGCTETYDGTLLELSGDDIKTKENTETTGFTEKVCLKATVGTPGTFDQTIVTHELKIEQQGACAATLSVTSAASAAAFDKTVAWGEASTKSMATASTFFENKGGDAACDITSCTVKASGCAAVAPDGKLQVGDADKDFALSFVSAPSKAGLDSIDRCYSCTNG